LEVLLPLEARKLGSKCGLPRSSLRTHALATEEARQRMRSFPCSYDTCACTHPDPDDGWEQTNRPEATISLGQKDDENQIEDASPSSHQLKLGEQSSKGTQRFF